MRRSDEFDDPRSCFAEAHALLGATRPTAVNLRWALEHGREVFERAVAGGGGAVEAALLALADDMVAAQADAERRIGEHGTAIVTEVGVLEAPYEQTVAAALAGGTPQSAGRPLGKGARVALPRHPLLGVGSDPRAREGPT